MERLKERRGVVPEHIQVDNGSEVHLEGIGQVGTQQPGLAGLLTARKTDGQRVYRIIQRQLSR